MSYSKKHIASPNDNTGESPKRRHHKVYISFYHSLFNKYKPVQTDTGLSNNSVQYGHIDDRFLPIANLKSPESKSYCDHGNGIGGDARRLNSSGEPISTNGIGRNEPSASTLIPITSRSLGYNRRQIHDNFETLVNLTSNRNHINIVSSADIPRATTSNNSPLKISLLDYIKSKEKSYQKCVANALGYTTAKIYLFRPLKSPKITKQLCTDLSGDSAFVQKSVKDNSKSEGCPRYTPDIPFKVLDAPGLRNDYYSNLVCWANKSNMIGAGLGSTVYCWNEKFGAIPLHSLNNDIISALAFSTNDFLAVGTKNSKVYIYQPRSVFVIATYDMNTNSSVCSIKWIPNSTLFFLGNDTGDVTLLELIQTNNDNNSSNLYQAGKNCYGLKLIVKFKCDQQQICGIDVNNQGTQLAIGANNNCASIWDISDLHNPKKTFHLKHEAAVKAVAFCPWVPNLLATGGGSRDKHIRFWHSKSGTLLSKHKTKGQVTAVIWSRSRREILATFGFGEPHDRNGILSVYSYPEMKLKINVNAPADLRILTADISNDFNSICASISDQSVRIYSVWNSKMKLKTAISNSGTFGSKIIDYEEGVHECTDTIR